jgi:hypothetical protein
VLVRHSVTLVLALCCAVPTASRGQSARPPHVPVPALSDSAVGARERAVWDALAQRDSATAANLVGTDVPFTLVSASGVTRGNSSALLGQIARRCEISRSELSDVGVVRPSESTMLVTYHVDLDRTCGANHLLLTAWVTSVWVARDGRWIGVSQTFVPAKS